MKSWLLQKSNCKNLRRQGRLARGLGDQPRVRGRAARICPAPVRMGDSYQFAAENGNAGRFDLIVFD